MFARYEESRWVGVDMVQQEASLPMSATYFQKLKPGTRRRATPATKVRSGRLERCYFLFHGVSNLYK